MYADNTSVLIAGDSCSHTETLSEDVLSRLLQWFSINKLYLNTTKTQLISFKNLRGNHIPPKIYINNELLKYENDVKILGIHIDENLTWKNHCANLSSKLNSVVYLFRHLKPLLSIPLLLNLYYAEVHSRLIYGICFWGNSSLAKKLFICQKKILRVIAGISAYDSCRSLFGNFAILTLISLYIFMSCVFMYMFTRMNSFLIATSTP